jgi:glycosyltransferase involved in cell wall biosynthesis
VVENGVNGYLCEAKNEEALAAQMQKMIKLTPGERTEMGKAGREKVRQEFDEKVVNGKYLAAVHGILEKSTQR